MSGLYLLATSNEYWTEHCDNSHQAGTGSGVLLTIWTAVISTVSFTQIVLFWDKNETKHISIPLIMPPELWHLYSGPSFLLLTPNNYFYPLLPCPPNTFQLLPHLSYFLPTTQSKIRESIKLRLSIFITNVPFQIVRSIPV